MTQIAKIGIDQGLQVGTFIEADYYNPTGSGRIRLDFMQDTNNIAFHFNPRFDVNPNMFYLNTNEGGTWGTEETPSGYDFSYGIRMKVRVYADTDKFKIFINDKFVYQYKYRGLTSTQVKEVQFSWVGDDAVAAQLVSFLIGYM